MWTRPTTQWCAASSGQTGKREPQSLHSQPDNAHRRLLYTVGADAKLNFWAMEDELLHSPREADTK